MSSVDRSSGELQVCNLGIVPYRDALALQERLRARRQTGEQGDTLLLLEHPPVYTRGRRASADEVTPGHGLRGAGAIEVITTDRGGRVTYHAPGQLVGYPIMAIDDIGHYLRTIEAALIDALADTGVEGRTRCTEGPDFTGVWVDDRKIASIGVHVARGVTTHGFALNVELDLDPFSWVVSCGLPGVHMTSLAHELAPREAPGAPRLRSIVADRFARAFALEAHEVSIENALGTTAEGSAARELAGTGASR